MALLANCHRDPKRQRRAYTAADFDPTFTRPRRGNMKLTTNTIAAMAAGMGIKQRRDPCLPPEAA